MENDGKRLLTVDETAAFLNVKVSKIRSMVFRKEIGFIKIGALLRFDVDDLLSWLKSKKIENN